MAGQKILLIEDDPDITFMLKSALQAAGYEVSAAENGAKGLTTAKTFVPDLIIADLNMPVMSGWQFSYAIRQLEPFKNVPIIILSGLIAQESKPEAFEPYNVCLPKPFEISIVLENVKALLAFQGK